MQPNPLEAEIAKLRQQLDGIQVSPAVKPVEQNIVLTREDIRNELRSILKEEVAALQAQVPVVNQPVVPATPVQSHSIMSVVAGILSEEDKKWLSDIEKLKKLDGSMLRFLQTEDGKTFVLSFMSYFKESLK